MDWFPFPNNTRVLSRLRIAFIWFSRRASSARTEAALCELSCPLPCKEPCPLLALPIGTRALIVRIGCPLADASRLRVLGVFEGALVRIVDRRHGLLLDVCGSRLALDRAVAMHIIASPVTA
jgi:Fe2+ transport system protein FeoA